MDIQSNRSCCQDPAVNRSFSASETRLASISESRSLDMELVTAEGDKVTLSYGAYAAAFYAKSGQVDARDGYLGVRGTEVSTSKQGSELSIRVEGDLNRQERREIRKAIKTIGRMLKKFVQGRMKPMIAKAAKLSGLETVASLDVSMAYERHVVTARQADVALAYDRNADVLNGPMLPEAVDPAPMQRETDTLAREMADVVRATQAPQKSVLDVTERLLAYHHKAAARRGSLSADLFDRIRDRFNALMADAKASRAA